MDTATAEALEVSIKHWEKNAVATRAYDASIGTLNCALCGLFILEHCEGCPVMAVTGKFVCEGTPYDDALTAYYAWGRAELARKDVDLCREAFHEASKAEVVFLKSLRAA